MYLPLKCICPSGRPLCYSQFELKVLYVLLLCVFFISLLLLSVFLVFLIAVASLFFVGSARYMRFFFSCFSHISFSRIFYVYVAIDLRSFISDGLWSFGVCIFCFVGSCCVSVYNVSAVSYFVLRSFDAYCFVQRYWKYNWQFTSEKRSHNIVSLLTIIKYGNLTRFIVH